MSRAEEGKEIMDSFGAFMNAELNNELKVFDWDKAVEIIKKNGFTEAYAGLSSDLEWTGDCILRDGKPVMDCYTYLSSTWATPVLYIYDDDYEEIEYECYIMESETTYTSETKWPRSALSALGVDNPPK